MARIYSTVIAFAALVASIAHADSACDPTVIATKISDSGIVNTVVSNLADCTIATGFNITSDPTAATADGNIDKLCGVDSCAAILSALNGLDLGSCVLPSCDDSTASGSATASASSTSSSSAAGSSTSSTSASSTAAGSLSAASGSLSSAAAGSKSSSSADATSSGSSTSTPGADPSSSSATDSNTVGSMDGSLSTSSTSGEGDSSANSDDITVPGSDESASSSSDNGAATAAFTVISAFVVALASAVAL